MTDSTLPKNTDVFSKEETKTREQSNLKEMSSPGEPFLKIFETWGLHLEKKQNRYHILETIGEGGMGVIQRVRDQILGREIALKRIRIPSSEEALSSKQQQRLWRLTKEASITAMLEHPNIVPVYDLEWNEQGELYFTMRKIQGKTFTQILKDKRDFVQDYDENKLLGVFLKICDAVAYAHAQKIVHRDLKPDNVMVGQFGEVYVMDWGIAKNLKNTSPENEESLDEIDSKTLFKTIGGIGTPGYMPSEQRSNASQVTPQSDIFALGKILRECYTLQSPFNEFKEMMTFYSHEGKGSGDRKKRLLEAKIPRDIQAIVEKATAEKPEKRYPDVVSLVNDIENYQKHSRVSARTYQWNELLQKWFQRNRQSLRVLALILTSIFLFYSYSQWKLKQDRKVKQEQLLQQSQESKKKGLEIPGEQKILLSEKIQYLLQALNYVNSALFLQPNEPHLETEKLGIGQELIRLCCDTSDYHLASYLAQEMNNLGISSQNNTTHLMQQVTDAKTQQLRNHQKKLNFWIDELQKSDVDQTKIDNALLEISKMPEEEILQQLLTLLEEGVSYFLNEETFSSQKNKFYTILVDAIGRIENPKAGPPLFHALSKISEKILKIPPRERSLEILNFLVEIIQAMIRSKAADYAFEIHVIQSRFEESSLFMDKTTGFVERLYQTKSMIEVDPKNPREYYSLAAFYHHIRKLEQSSYYLNKALVLDPTNPDIYYLRSVNLMLEKKWKEASQDLHLLIQMYPEYNPAYIILAFTTFELGQYSQALKAFDLAIKHNPESYKAWMGRGKTKYELKDFDGALEDFTKLIELDPQIAIGYYFRAVVRKEKKDLSGALKDLDQSILRKNDQGDALVLRAQIRFSLNQDLDGIFEDLNHALNYNPLDKVSIYLLLSMIHSSKKDFTKSIEILNELIRLEPSSWEAYISRGASKSELNDWKGALEDFLVAQPYRSQDALLQFNIANAYRSLEFLDQALKYYSQAIVLNPEYYDAYYNRGNLRFQLNDLAGALEDLNKIIFLKNDFIRAYELRGKILFQMGNLQAAQQDYEYMIYLDPRSAIAHFHLANIKHVRQDLQGALVHYSKAIEFNPQNPLPIYSRARVKQEMGQIQEAFEDVTLAIQLNPNDANFYNLRGLLNDLQNAIPSAFEDYQKAIALNSRNETIYFNLAMLYVKTKQHDLELEVLEKGLSIAPDPFRYQQCIERLSNILMQQAINHYRKKEYSDAKKDLQRIQPYIPPQSPLFARFEKMLQQIETQLKTLENPK